VGTLLWCMMCVYILYVGFNSQHFVFMNFMKTVAIREI